MEKIGPLKPMVAPEIALQTCRALQQLHVLGITHRDQAARNVMVFAISTRSHHDVLVKVGDFTLSGQATSSANSSSSSTSNSESDFCFGDSGKLPVRWASPEVFQRRKFGEKSDVWAMGVVMWEIYSLAMLPYYELPTDEQVIRAVVGGTKLSLPAGCPTMVFDRCILPCWALAAADRPTSADLAQLLRAEQEEIIVVEDNPQSRNLCCICLARPSTHAIVPCGHLCLCDTAGCIGTFQGRNPAPCPICRYPVQTLLNTNE